MIDIRDRIALEERLACIAWAVSQGDRAGLRSQCLDNACWQMDGDHTPEQWLDLWMSHPGAPGHQLWTTNVLLQPMTPDRVLARSYLMMPYFGQTVVPATFIMALGTVTDQLVRVGQDWQLMSRRVDWGPPDSAPEMPLAFPVDASPATGAAPATNVSAGSVSPEDRVAIADLYADYAWALDTGDGLGCAEMFTSDGLLTDPGGSFIGRAAIFNFLGGLHAHNASFRGRQHWAGSPQIVMEGEDRARARAFACVPSHHDNGAVNLDLVASYFDRLVKADGQWWFAERLITPWTGAPLALFPRYAPIGDRS